jgi:SAM-dependent methyltransferase
MDGTDLGYYPDGTFDFAWSLSSIEHFGSHDKAGDAVREMARVVRKGGVLAIATEYLLLAEQTHPEFFNRAEFEEYILGASKDLDLIEPVNWDLPPTDYLIDSIVLWDNVGRTRRHIVLQDDCHQWTSILVFFRKT